ncbi:MAG TPA: hypothetical protein VN901_22835 [Candidatus Acidoferrales bacterium]|nr:hypothetical protein [Candidatus Acidoferrales bacterium]
MADRTIFDSPAESARSYASLFGNAANPYLGALVLVILCWLAPRLKKVEPAT